MRSHRTTFIVLLTAMMMFTACGGSDDKNPDSGGESPAAEEGTDAEAINATVPDFMEEVASEFGSFSEPFYDEATEAVIGLQPTGVDAVVFCDRLSDFLGGKGFEGVPISVRFNAQSEELAGGTSGGKCEFS